MNFAGLALQKKTKIDLDTNGFNIVMSGQAYIA